MDTIAGRNPFAYGKPITLDTLDDLFSHHRANLAGWNMGPDGDDGGSGGGEGGSGGQGGGSGSGSGGSGGGQGGSGSGSDGQGGAGQNATDADGKDLGYPKDTPWTEMSDKQAIAYWRHNSKRHEGRVKDLVGDRSAEDIKKDLDEYARLQREQQTPAEQALTDARTEGKRLGLTEARRESAIAIYRGALETGGITGDELDEAVESLNVDRYIGDSGVDTTKLTNFAKRFTSSDKENSGGGSGRRRDFGGGQRRSGEQQRGSGGKSEAERRFGKKKSTSDE